MLFDPQKPYRREAGVPFQRGRRDSREAAQGAQPHKRELNENYTKGEYFRKFIK